MSGWRLLPDEEARSGWDDALRRFRSVGLYQTYRWGEHRRRLGWPVYRWLHEDGSGRPSALFQALEKQRLLGVAALWGPSGPVGDPAVWGESLQDALKTGTGARALYVRVYSHELAGADTEAVLVAAGWRRPARRLRSGLSMQLVVDADPNAQRARLSKNWRHNLKRAEKRGLRVSRWPAPDVDELLGLYGAMEAHKGLEEQFTREELTGILEAFGEDVALFQCRDDAGALLGVRGAVVGAPWAWDTFAAASPEGRKAYASYALMWAVLDHCRDAGVTRYELMGVDPEANPGVTNFKRGTGADPVTFAGEWEWADPAALRTVVGWRLGRSGVGAVAAG